MSKLFQKGLFPRISFLSRNDAFIRGLTVRYHSTDSIKKRVLPVADAIDFMKNNARAKFDETTEIALQLGVDPRKADQIVRGSVRMPYGIGKTVRVAAFARGAAAEAAQEAGASRVGAEDLVQDIQNGNLDFDKCVATPDMMPLLKNVARILGPRGMMPNKKVGTLTEDVATAVKASMGGQVEFRAGKNGVLHAGFGKVSFEKKALMENLKAFMVAISNAKPEGAKGKYIKAAHVSSTMGPGIKVDVATLDPGSARFFIDDQKQEIQP
mmetsp:Transcript_6908/g.9259  ORF Transcript_6908/g.9259 Transcript_6908/m.9259 type:complete len:268 (+) Transcript_6908:126-929(+)